MLDNTMKNKPNSKRREVLKKMTFTSLGLPIISQFKMYDSKKKYDFNQKKMRGKGWIFILAVVGDVEKCGRRERRTEPVKKAPYSE